jgi:hypothetical protein
VNQTRSVVTSPGQTIKYIISEFITAPTAQSYFCFKITLKIVSTTILANIHS